MASRLHPASAPTAPMTLALIGPIVRLQVQSALLKAGDRPHRWYDPSSIEGVDSLVVDAGGVTGLRTGLADPIADVHHRDHPQTKFRGENGISIGFASHYRQMRQRFGDHLVDGVAGENILVHTSNQVSIDALRNGLIAITRDGPLALGSVVVATPCVEFTRFCCGYPPERPADVAITDALRVLDNGLRGFYLSWTEEPLGALTLSLGDLLYARVVDESSSNGPA